MPRRGRGMRLLEPEPIYERLDNGSEGQIGENGLRQDPQDGTFSWVEYSIFLLVGIAMLWAWNMFLAAAPYFQHRFRTSENLLKNFQATEVSVSTLANLGSMIILTKLQTNASYPRRIVLSLVTLTTSFALLAVSAKAFTGVSAAGYFGFFVVMVFVCSVAVGFIQNGSFSFVASYGRSEYMQGLMTGQAVAGVLPPLVQIISVLSIKGNGNVHQEDDPSTSAMVYFLAATGVSALTLLSFFYLLRYHPSGHATVSAESAPLPAEEESTESDFYKNGSDVSLVLLARKLFLRAAAVFLTFGVTMVFPVFTQEIESTNPSASPLFHRTAFIPFAFLVWNLGDLLGRLVPLIPRLSLASRPTTLLILAVLRIVWIPLYLICNINNKGDTATGFGTVMPDAFYLIVVQFLFGLTNGAIGASAMMGIPHDVDESEKEAAGGFMGLAIVGGLAVGSVCSFSIANR